MDIQRYQENQSKKEFHKTHLIGDTIGHFTECNKEYLSDDSRVQNSIPESIDYQFLEHFNLDNNSIKLKRQQNSHDDLIFQESKNFSILEINDTKQEIKKTHYDCFNNINQVKITDCEYNKQKLEEPARNNSHLKEKCVKINLNNKIYISKENLNNLNNLKIVDNVRDNINQYYENEEYEQEEEYEEDEKNVSTKINRNLVKGKINPDGNIKMIVHNK